MLIPIKNPAAPPISPSSDENGYTFDSDLITLSASISTISDIFCKPFVLLEICGLYWMDDGIKTSSSHGHGHTSLLFHSNPAITADAQIVCSAKLHGLIELVIKRKSNT